MAINTLETIIAWLKADAAIADLVSTRIYGLRLKPGAKSLFPCISVIRSSSRGIDDDLPIEHLGVDIRCYGTTQAEAENVYRALCALHGLTDIHIGSATIYSAKMIAGPNDLDESPVETEAWISIYTSWLIKIDSQ